MTRLVAQSPTWIPVGGFHAGTPATYSAGIGVGAVVSRRLTNVNRMTYDDSHVFLIAEPGWTTARASVGYGTERHRLRTSMLTNLRVTALRRWTHDPVADYLGVEGAAVAMEESPLGARVGVFRRIAGPTNAHRWLFAVDFPAGW